MDNSVIFSPFTAIEEVASGSEYGQFYSDYFINSSVCWEVFGLGLLISVALCLVFYLGIGNYVYVLSKRVTWLVFLIVSCVAVYFASQSYIIGYHSGELEGSSGLYEQSYKTCEKLSRDLNNEEESGIIWQKADDYREVFNSGSSIDDDAEIEWKGRALPRSIALVNMIYSLIVFVILSVCVKRYTIHARAIPF